MAILWGLLYKGIRDSDSKYRVYRSKTRLGLGLGLVILEGTRLGIGLGIVEVSCKVSDSESRLENLESGNFVLMAMRSLLSSAEKLRPALAVTST